MASALLVIQCGTYVGLGGLLLYSGQVRLGIAQLLLAGVQAAVFA